MENVFVHSIFIPGTLAANHTVTFLAPWDCQLVHVSGVGSGSNAATLKVGTSADDDGYITSGNLGVSGTPLEWDLITDFAGVLAGSQFPHITKGTIVLVTITDHVSHAANVYVALTFTKG